MASNPIFEVENVERQEDGSAEATIRFWVKPPRGKKTVRGKHVVAVKGVSRKFVFEPDAYSIYERLNASFEDFFQSVDKSYKREPKKALIDLGLIVYLYMKKFKKSASELESRTLVNAEIMMQLVKRFGAR